jgi:hypothetical protein
MTWYGDVLMNRKQSLNSDGLFFPADLAHSDFHLFGALKKDVIRGKMFGSDDNVIEEVGKWLRVQNLKWYKRGTETLVSRCCKTVEVDGDIQRSEVCNTSI